MKNPEIEIIVKFKSIDEFNQWKREITKEDVIKEHSQKLELIDEIITFAMNNPKKIHILQDFIQVGGDTLEEYFKRRIF